MALNSRLIIQLITGCMLGLVFLFGLLQFYAAKMVFQGDVREACYLAIAFDNFRREHGTEPTVNDVKSFPSRIEFFKREGNRYLFKCGLYGKSLLIIQLNEKGTFDFFVEG
ncbi:hypothetical protein SH449x_005186 [Pirellulaceae bacterium SH449]